jgi:hypothetical protein
MPSCSGIKADGGRCRAQAIRGSEWCFNHHPDYEQQRRQRASKGGKRGGRGRPQVELADLKGKLSALADDVLEARVSRSNAAVAAQILNVYLRAVSVELKVVEQRELIERLEALEHSAQTEGGRRWRA